MHFKKLFASLLAGVFTISLCACNNNNEAAVPTVNDYVVTQDTIAEMFNTAVSKLNDAKSYTMSGSVTSASDIAESEVFTSVHAPITCLYQDGKLYFDSDNNNDPHETYFDGERYYYSIPEGDTEFKYYVTANDHGDYAATDYLMHINAEIVLAPTLSKNDDGSSDISFEMPFAIYESPALIGWLGFIVDESHASNTLKVYATIDADGYFKSFMFSFVNDTNFGEIIHQEIAVSMTLSNYNSTVVNAPSDLGAYEDWSDSEMPSSTHGMEPIPPEDIG